MQYLAQWRMQLAARLLSRGNASVAAAGLEVGYDSEAAFSRAFKKLVGTSPGAWRRRQAGPAAADDDLGRRYGASHRPELSPPYH
jgi:AraC-like DNA-binding protein